MGGKGKSCECTLETKVLFFCIWTIVTGLFAAIIIGSLIPMVIKNNSEHLGFFVTLLVLAVIEMVAGSCMTIAFYKVRFIPNSNMNNPYAEPQNLLEIPFMSMFVRPCFLMQRYREPKKLYT
ncbi:uncharacterized protein LOC26527303 [Drosophila mojavensis]|uniref:uncharacterized protein LOC26527303 n=1 Tax=Drosophila mojavensis TaxID=7230 RepID=UPI001CD0DA4F|nr:uncharacterized protein LOC26527303 [Drosophila mojavensis]